MRIVLPLKYARYEFAELAHDLVVDDILPSDKILCTVKQYAGCDWVVSNLKRAAR